MWMEILEKMVFGNRIMDYAWALLILLVSLLFVKMVIRVFIRRIKKFAEKSVTTIDDLFADILERAVLPLLYLVCFYISLKTLKLPSEADIIFKYLKVIAVIYFGSQTAILVVSWGMNTYLSKKRQDPALVRSLEGMLWVIKFLIWVFAVVALLDNLGYKVSTLIAGLGIGGVAVAFAAQALLKDFFSYFSIVFDHPFKIGDFIIIGDYMGTVEHIGIKTTRIRSLGGEQLIFSNTDLTDSRVRNYQLMEKRRVLFKIGVTYETPLDQLKAIPKIIEAIIKGTKDALFDRAHFVSYGDSSLVYEIVYYVMSPDYNKYMDIQQAINLAIKEEFQKRGINFAYPTQTIYLPR